MYIYRRCRTCGNCPCTCGCNGPTQYPPVTIVGATGPTGPTGPQGPATITVGQTITGEPETQASVVSTGGENAVLTFTIPRGATGATEPVRNGTLKNKGQASSYDN